MAVKVIRKFRMLFDVVWGTPSDGDVPQYDAGQDKLVMAPPVAAGGAPSGPAGGVLGGTYPNPSFAADMATQAELDAAKAEAVVVAPAASSRNVIVPTAGSVIAAVLKAHAAQAVDLLQFQDSAGVPFLSVDEAGRIGQGARAGAALFPVDLRPTLVSTTETDGFGYTGALAMGLQIQSFAADLAANGPDIFYGIHSVVKTPANDKTHNFAIGIDAGAIFRGTAPAGPNQGTVYGGRFAAQDFDYGPGGAAATGPIGLITGSESIAVHGAASPISTLIGQTVYVDAENLVGVVPGPVSYGVIAQTVDVFTGDGFGTIPRLYGSIFSRSHFANTPVTDAVGILLTNFGHAGTATSYALKIEAQSGSTATYALGVLGGKSLFVDGLLIGLIAAPVDAFYANGQGGWWWDQANSLPKWKGRTSGGVIVNFTPADAQALADHLADTTDAHDASAISIADAGNDFTATDVEGALAELQADAEADAQALTDHLSDSSDAHDASAISVVDSGDNYTATDVEGVLAEIAPQLGVSLSPDDADLVYHMELMA